MVRVMTPVSCIGKGLGLLSLAALGACGTSEGDASRFQGMADQVASIEVPLDGQARPARSARDMGLRDANAPLKVEVMTPYQLWDARDGALPPAPDDSEIAPALVRAAAPAVAAAAVDAVKARAAEAMRPAFPATRAKAIQLGAYSSEDAARAAWNRLSRDPALSHLQPTYERAEVNGRVLTRLKVRADQSSAAEVCRAARIDDPWCARSAA